LPRMANMLGKVDILILPCEVETSASARFWFFVPRLLHENTLVFVERVSDDGQPEMRLKPHEEILALAAPPVRRAA
jgi:hypothetical protein